MLAPDGISKVYDKASPAIQSNMPKQTERIIMCFKVNVYIFAIDEGITSKAITNIIPTILIKTTIAQDNKINKVSSNFLTGMLMVPANASSKR